MPEQKLNVLVVDDDASLVRLISKLLLDDLSEIVQVHGLTNPREAMRWLDSHRCDILLSDIEMPGTNGLEMLRFAKKRNAWTQVIFITGHSTWDHIADAIEHGAVDYVLKPIDHSELVQLVRQECARQFRWKKVIAGTLKASATVPGLVS